MSDGKTFVVNRFDIAKTLSPQVWGKKSNYAGRTFYAPVLAVPEVKTAAQAAEANPDQKVLTNVEDILWYGPADMIARVNVDVRKQFADLMIDNTDEDTGEVNWEKLATDWAKFTEGIQKLSDVKEQIEALQDLINSYIAEDEFGATVDGTADGQKTERALELENLMRDAHARIRPLKVQKAAIEKEYAERAAKREARKQKETEAQAATK